jgi:hypothetical protein
MHRIPTLLALLLVFAAAAAGGEETGGAGGPGEPRVVPTARVTGERVVVLDSSDLPEQVRLESRPLQGKEMEEIREISRHPGTTGQLLLWHPPWRGPSMFIPGAVIPLETRKEREAREAARKAQEAGEEAPASPVEGGEETPETGSETGGAEEPPTTP